MKNNTRSQVEAGTHQSTASAELRPNCEAALTMSGIAYGIKLETVDALLFTHVARPATGFADIKITFLDNVVEIVAFCHRVDWRLVRRCVCWHLKLAPVITPWWTAGIVVCTTTWRKRA